MTDDVSTATEETTEDETATEDVEETTEEEQEPELGDAGKKALAAERQARRDANREAREAKAELDRLRAEIANKDKPTDEQELARARREAAAEATTKANARILRSEIRAAAAGKLADPADALAFLDMDGFDVNENGDVDASAIEDAISDLLTRKPHLSATKEKRFQQVNQNPKAPAAPGQLSKSDLDNMTPSQIEKARQAGRLDNLLGRKP